MSLYFWGNPENDSKDNPARGLTLTKRYSAYNYPENIRRQSVAEHVFGCLHLLEELGKICELTPASFHPLVYAVMHHDDAESITGDIPRPIKNSEEYIASAESEVLDSLTPCLNTLMSVDLIKSVVDFVDILECAQYSMSLAEDDFVMMTHESEKLHEIALKISQTCLDNLPFEDHIKSQLHLKFVKPLTLQKAKLSFNEKTIYSRTILKEEVESGMQDIPFWKNRKEAYDKKRSEAISS